MSQVAIEQVRDAQTPVALVGAQASLQAPQCERLVARSTQDEPQIEPGARHSSAHIEVPEVESQKFPAPQLLPQPLQWSPVPSWVSQSGVAALQFANVASQTRTHAPETQDAVVFAATQLVLQAPQCTASLCRSISQPFARLPSQSSRPALQVATQRPSTQATLAEATLSHSVERTQSAAGPASGPASEGVRASGVLASGVLIQASRLSTWASSVGGN